MAAKDTKLMVFAHLGTAWAPCGQLVLTEEADRLLASSFAYGLNYLKRSDALEVDPVSLSLADREAVRAKRLLPANRLPFFGGIRDAAPDAWGRRVIEAKLKVPANSLPESQYLLHAGSERVGAHRRAGRSAGDAHPPLRSLLGSTGRDTRPRWRFACDRPRQGVCCHCHPAVICRDTPPSCSSA